MLEKLNMNKNYFEYFVLVVLEEKSSVRIAYLKRNIFKFDKCSHIETFYVHNSR